MIKIHIPYCVIVIILLCVSQGCEQNQQNVESTAKAVAKATVVNNVTNDHAISKDTHSYGIFKYTIEGKKYYCLHYYHDNHRRIEYYINRYWTFDSLDDVFKIINCSTFNELYIGINSVADLANFDNGVELLDEEEFAFCSEQFKLLKMNRKFSFSRFVK